MGTLMKRWASNIKRPSWGPTYLLASPMQRGTWIWLSAAVLATLALTTVVWRFSVDLLPFALAAETRFGELRQLSVDEFPDDDGAAVIELRVKVNRLEKEVSPALRYMDWLKHFSPALTWLPPLDEEILAWAAQADRLQKDLDSASTLLSASSQLLDTYGRAEDILLSPRAGPPSAILRDRALGFESSFSTTSVDVADAVRAGQRLSPAFRLARLRDAMSLLEEAEGRMLSASRVGQRASALLVDLLEIGDRVQPLVGELVIDGYESEPLTLEELGTTLAELDERLQFAAIKSNGLARLVSGSVQSSSLQDRMDLLRDVLGVLLIVNGAARVGLQALEPAIHDAEASETGLLEDDGALVGAFDGVLDHKAEIGEALTLLEDARRTLADLEAGNAYARRVRPLGDLITAVGLLQGGLQLAETIAPIGSDLVGANSTRRYLVLGHSADELRATGGFVSSIWLVTFEEGALTDIQYHDVVLVDDTERLVLYPQAPLGLEEHMNARVWLLRDVSWEPDFPTTARTAADLYWLGQRRKLDGVIALNQWTLLAILESLGSIRSPGGGAPITTRNLLPKLEQETDEHGRAYADLALQGIVERLNEPISLSALMKFASALYLSLQERDLLLYLNDPKLQAVVEEGRWDGRLRDDPTDYLYVVDSNVGWSKSDRNIEREVSYKVDLRNGSRPRINLTMRYNNHSGPGSPGCEPQWSNRGTNYSAVKNACYWNFWRVYIPQEARLLSSTPLPLPEYSVSAEIGRGRPGEDTVRVSSSYNRMVVSGLFALEARDETEIELVYDLPPGILRREGDDLRYQLLIQKQPGARRRDTLVEFLLPEGYGVASSSIAPVLTGDAPARFLIRVEQDRELEVVFSRNVNDAS